MHTFPLRAIAPAVLLSLSIAGYSQVPHPHTPPPLPPNAHSSRPVPPGATNLPPREGASPSSSLNSSTWTPIGPASLQSGGGLVSGRVTGIAVDPTNSSNIYVAAAGGGVWNTTNGGTSWAPLTDTQTTLAMGAIAIAPTNHLKIYAGTGEANNSEDSNHGEGILVSDDGGSTWTLRTALGAFDGVVIGQIAVDPTNADVAYAAVGGYGENGTGGNTGIWKTTDGGTTWTNMTGADSLDTNAPWSAVVIDPNTPTTIYAAIGDFAGSYGDNGIYRSVDSGAHWSVLANGPSTTAFPTIGRIALAVSPAAKIAGKHVLYVAVAGSPYSSSGGLIYFGRSDTADAATPTFTNLTSGTPDFLGGANGGGQGWYDIAVAVDANGNVYCSGVENYNAGGIDAIITSSNLGANWTDISIVNNFEPHTDNHAIAFDSSNRMLAGNDGGIFRYDPATPGWTDLNSNLQTIQFTGIGLHPTDLGTVVGGSQDNGTELYSDNVLWVERAGGDGGFAKISQTNPMHCYHEYTGASIERSDDGCMTFTVNIYSGLFANIPYSPDSSNFYAPYTLDPSNGDHVLFGTDYVNESTNAGSSWAATGTPGVHSFNPADSSVDSIALSPANGPNPQVIYASVGGTFASSSQIFVTSNDGAAWTEHDLPTCPSRCRVNQIVTDPSDLTGQTAFAVTNTFTGGGRHVYRTTNEGASWTDITGNLPDSPTWSVQVDTDTNHTAYVSNEIGVYSSVSPYSTWTLYGTGLPHAQGVDLELNSSLHALGLATHGRGAWEILAVSQQAATLTTPTPGSTLSGTSATFSWTAGVGVTYYRFRLGTTGVGSSNVYNAAGSTTTALSSPLITSIPAYGAPLYARLSSWINGAWQNKDYTYTESGAPVKAVLTTPTPGSTLSGTSATFSWTAGGGVTIYRFRLGTTGVGSSNVYNAAGLTTTALSSPLITGIPAYGAPLYARLCSWISAAWQCNDYTYKESGAAVKAVLTTPTPGSTLAGTSATFSWTAGGGVTTYRFRLGTTGVGSSNVYNAAGSTTTALSSPLITGIPAYGAPLYARLCSWISSAWQCNDYTYTESGSAVKAVLTSPTPGSTLSGSSATFSWTAGGGVTQYRFRLGTTGPGSSDVYNAAGSTTTALTTGVVSGIPTTGGTVYARLSSWINGAWQNNDYTYTEQ